MTDPTPKPVRYSQATIDEMQRRQVAYGNPPFSQEIVDRLQAEGRPVQFSGPAPAADRMGIQQALATIRDWQASPDTYADSYERTAIIMAVAALCWRVVLPLVQAAEALDRLRQHGAISASEVAHKEVETALQAIVAAVQECTPP